MASVEINLTCNLQTPVKVQYIDGNMFSLDNAGNTINVLVFNGEEPAELGGSVAVSVIRSDGATVAVSGAISGNKAYAILPQSCYAVPGVVSVVVKNVQSTTVTTLAAFVANVYQTSTETTVDPGTIIPSISALIAQIEAAVDSVPADYSALLATIAADYSSSKTYPTVGAYAWCNGVLRRSIVPITTAETYNSAHWTDAVIGDDLSALKSAFDSLDGEVNGGSTSVTPKTADINLGKYWGVNSVTLQAGLAAGSNYNASSLLDISYFEDGTTVKIMSSVVGSNSAAILDADLKAIDYVNGNNASEKGYTASSVPQVVTFTKTNKTKYIVATIRTSYYNGASDFAATGTAKGVFQTIEKTEKRLQDQIDERIEKATELGVNLYDPSKASTGYISSSDGTLGDTSGTTYITSDFIPIANGQSVVINKVRDFLAFDASKQPITASYVNTSQTNYTYTATENGYIRASLFVSESTANMIAYGTTLPAYQPYMETVKVENGIHLSQTMGDDAAKYSGNVLNGKKWIACGDSFTAGAYNNSPTDDYTFDDMPYYGEYKVYPFFIGRRNHGLTVINEAIAGSQMSAGGTNPGNNAFSQNRYKEIPVDADYVTLMFGINDAGHGVPLGEITDSTNGTFYGAWNVVLGWLIENRPFTHFGIIIGPGMQTPTGRELAEAEIAIAKKWGIPYLNIQFESGGEKIPLMLRTNNPDVASAVRALRTEQQVVNSEPGSENLHPNQKAHEFESTFIEAWLRTL